MQHPYPSFKHKMSKDIIPPNPKDSDDSNSEKSESQILNSPNREISKSDIELIKTFPEIQEDVFQVYTIDDMISLFYHAMVAGGNAKQYTIDNQVSPSNHIAMLDNLLKDVEESANPEQAIKFLLSNNMVLLGRIDEIINKTN